ncbi:MAG: NADH-quinone oxidoreductase subunit N [Bythopirellula sp.]|nr:NADH-quinone oxidoreductase subunit N [Bythopirellula sp.]
MNGLAANMMGTARLLVPEFILIFAASLLVLWACFASAVSPEARQKLRTKSVLFGAITLIVAGATYFLAPGNVTLDPARVAFLNDALAQVLRPAGFIVGLVLLIFLAEQLHPRYAAEQVACLLLLVAGMNLVATANDSIALFVSLELVSIPTYILLYLSRTDSAGLEATAKYFLLSIFSSAFVLYGLSIFMGAAGSTNFVWLKQSLAEPTGMVSVGLLQIAVAMVIAGLGFRITAVPFHFYAPDVFQGTTTPMAGLLAVLPKFVGFAALLRLVWSIVLTKDLNPAFAALTVPAPEALAILAIVTMTVGNVLALLQNDLRRLLAYSSVAHAGYMLVGLAVLPDTSAEFSGAQAVLFYLLIYAMMTLGVFGTLLLLKKNGKPIETVHDIDGIGSTSPLLALVLAIFLFSLTGLPPTGGFWGKFNLFLAAWSTGSSTMRFLAFGLAINAAIAGWYYLRLVRRAYLHPQTEAVTFEANRSPALTAVVALGALLILGLFFFPNPLWQLLAQAG